MADEQQPPRALLLSVEIPQTQNVAASVLWRLFAGYGGHPEAAEIQGTGQSGCWRTLCFFQPSEPCA